MDEADTKAFGDWWVRLSAVPEDIEIWQAALEYARNKQAEVVRELYGTLQAIIADGVHCDVVPHLHLRGIAALKSAKEHGL